MKLSVVLPSYNESENIVFVINELINSINNIKLITNHEIIIVDDHSTDNSFEKINDEFPPEVKCIRLSRRSGSHVAIRAGLAQAEGDVVLCISADGQDNPDTLEKMIHKIVKENTDIVWAVRIIRKEPLLYKFIANTFYKILKKLTQIDHITFDFSKADFYLLNRKVVNAINQCNERNTSLFGLILWLGFRQDYVEYERRERHSGKSKWTYRTLFHLAKDWIIAFSGLPLKLMAVVGLIFAVCGFLYACFIVFYALAGKTIPGWATTTILILTLGGVQMIMIGIVGEYLWRNLDETRRRPLFFIEKMTNK